MANGYISQVKLPGGGIYEIKDKWAREQIAGGVSFVVCSSASDTPIGVTWTNEQGQVIQGTLKASEAQRGTFYLVPAYGDGYTVDSSDSTGDQSHFDEYVAAQVGSTYMWERLGRKDIDLTNYLRVDDAADTYLKKATDTATGVHTYTYAGEAIKVTGNTGAVVVGPISNNSAKVTASTLTMRSTTANDKAELTKDSLKIYNGNATPFTVAEAGSVTVQSATANDKALLTKDSLTVYNQSTAAYAQVGQTAVVVQSSANAKTTVGTSSVKVQADATQNVTVGTTKVTITGCSSVTSEWDKSELKFTPATAGQTMEVKSDGTIVKKTGTNGATTNTYSFNGDFASNNNAVVRKSELVEYVGGVGTYVQKSGDTMSGSLTVTADASTANHVRVGFSDEHLDVDYNKLTIVNNCGQSTPVELDASSLTIKDSCGTTTLNGADTASIVHTCGSGTSADTYSFRGDFAFNNNAVVRKSDLADWDGSNKYVKKAGDTMSGALTNTYAGDAIVLTGTGGAVKVAPISTNTYASLGDSTLRMGNSSSGADNDKAELTRDSLQIYLNDANKYTKVEGDKVTVQDSATVKTEVDKTSVKITNGNASATTVLTSTYSSNVTTAKIEATGTSTSVKTTYAFPSTTGGDSTFAGSHAANTTVMRKGDLKALAFKSSGTVPGYPTSGTCTITSWAGSATVHKWKLGTTTSKNVTFTEVADSATSFQYQPKGTISGTAATVPVSGHTVTALSTSAGKEVMVSYTNGSLPSLTMTMDTTNAEQLNITWSAGSLTTFTKGSSVTSTSTVTALSGASDIACTMTQGTFTGKKNTVTSVYPGALTNDGTESATVTMSSGSGTVSLTAGTGTQNVTFS